MVEQASGRLDRMIGRIVKMQEREQVKDKNHSIYSRWTWIQSLKQGSSDEVLRGNVHEFESESISHSVMSDSLRSHRL